LTNFNEIWQRNASQCFTHRQPLKFPEFKNSRKVQHLVHEKWRACIRYFLKLSAIHCECTHHQSDGKIREKGYLPCAWSASGNMMRSLIICTHVAT